MDEQKTVKELVIIGGGIAGLSAAIYAAQAGAEVTVYEALACGGQIVQSDLVKNYPGLEPLEGWELAEKLRKAAKSEGVIIQSDTVTELSRAENGTGFYIKTTRGGLEAKSVIMANGVKRRKLGVPNEEKLLGRGVSVCAVCDGPMCRGKTVAVIGGGNSAVGEAAYLSEMCEKVYLINRREELRATNAAALKAVRERGNVELLAPYVVNNFVCRDDGTLSAIILRNTITDNSSTLPVDRVFVSAGMEPDTGFCKLNVPRTEEGLFAVKEDCRTPINGLFAAGDCREKPLRQLVTAAADGAVAGTAAAEYLRELALNCNNPYN